ncbi:hypothetical protein V1264_013666 [Littorina saxatilis]|uniref:Uncharacterized protein n=1 Tax=Littorina saxatilis TaxID=31220 RepID=A0AAN9GIU7_9CAEN
MDQRKSQSCSSNSSPGPRWGSPALRPMATFPPMNRMTAPQNATPPHRPPLSSSMSVGGRVGRGFIPGMGSGSPQFERTTHPNSFRTPQPQLRHHSPNSPRPPWTDNRGYNQRRPRFSGNHSPHGGPNVNPGGSDDIMQYYHPSMLDDPWRDVPPKPVNHWLRS